MQLLDVFSYLRGANGLCLGSPTLYHGLEMFSCKVIGFVTSPSGIRHGLMFSALKTMLSHILSIF